MFSTCKSLSNDNSMHFFFWNPCIHFAYTYTVSMLTFGILTLFGTLILCPIWQNFTSEYLLKYKIRKI